MVIPSFWRIYVQKRRLQTPAIFIFIFITSPPPLLPRHHDPLQHLQRHPPRYALPPLPPKQHRSTAHHRHSPSPRKVFCRSAQSYGIVNLKPLIRTSLSSSVTPSPLTPEQPVVRTSGNPSPPAHPSPLTLPAHRFALFRSASLRRRPHLPPPRRPPTTRPLRGGSDRPLPPRTACWEDLGAGVWCAGDDG